MSLRRKVRKVLSKLHLAEKDKPSKTDSPVQTPSIPPVPSSPGLNNELEFFGQTWHSPAVDPLGSVNDENVGNESRIQRPNGHDMNHDEDERRPPPLEISYEGSSRYHVPQPSDSDIYYGQDEYGSGTSGSEEVGPQADFRVSSVVLIEQRSLLGN
jgi:hypothetical protein